MGVNYGAAVSRAWKYAANGRRLAAFFAFVLIALAFVLVPLYLIFRSIANMALSGVFNFFGLIGSAVYALLGFAVAILILFYVTLLFTHNYANQKSLSRSASAAKSIYFRFLAASIITGAITFAVLLVPFAGFVLALIAGFAFFFVPQEIAVSNSDLGKALSNSYNLFRKKWVDTIITLILSGLMGFLVMLVFAIPLIAAGFAAIASAASSGIAAAFLQNLGALAVTGLIALFGASLGMLFSNSIRTDVYMQLKRKK